MPASMCSGSISATARTTSIAPAVHRSSARSRPIPAGRSASSPICRGRSCGSAISPTARSSSSTGAPVPPRPRCRRPATRTRAPLPHPEIFAALQPGTDLLLDDGKVRLRVIDCGADFAETEVRRRRHAVGPQGRQRAACGAADLGDDRQRTAPTCRSRWSTGVDWIALSFVQRPDDVAEGRKLIGNAAGLMVKLEKPAAIRPARRDHRPGRRADGGARRPRRRDAARRRADRAEADHPRLPRRRQAGHRRDPDARIDDHRADPDPRRGLRRRDRGLRGRRRGDAVGGNRGRAIPDRGGRDDGPHRPPGAAGPALFQRRSTPAACRPSTPIPTRSAPPPVRSPRPSAPPRS